jgi:hypothetical protein
VFGWLMDFLWQLCNESWKWQASSAFGIHFLYFF